MDNLLFGLGVTAVGMLVVFFGLIVLIGLIKIMTMLSQSKKPKEKEAVACSCCSSGPCGGGSRCTHAG